MHKKIQISDDTTSTSFNLSPEVRQILKDHKHRTGKPQTALVEEGIRLLDEMWRTGRDAASIQKQKALQAEKTSIESLLTEKLSERDRNYLSDLLANSDEYRDILAQQILGIALIYHARRSSGKADKRTR